MSPPIRVLIADDHQAVLKVLWLMLRFEEGVEVVGLATDGAEAVEIAAAARPNVVVMDYGMPRMNGAEATRRIVESGRGTAVVGLSMHGEMGNQMRAAGAVTCLDKARGLRDVLSAIRIAAELPPLSKPAVSH